MGFDGLRTGCLRVLDGPRNWEPGFYVQKPGIYQQLPKILVLGTLPAVKQVLEGVGRP